MFTSKYLLTTLRENPAEAEVISHKLMLRAGLIKKLASGIYTWLPLGLRVLKKVENIIREEMNNIGALEILMPAIQPAALWIESNRWNAYGDQLLKIRDRHGNDFCFGPTHEEIITDIARRELRSYKQLPIIFYQIQTKFRDEIRPRFGAMRSREFIMKDAYSFHIDDISMMNTYSIMYDLYCRIFEKLGLNFRAVLADSGDIGGSTSHEFHVLADSGEDLIAYSDSGNYAANIETATCLSSKIEKFIYKDMNEISISDFKTLNELAIFLNLDQKSLLKTLFVKGQDVPVIALLLRADHNLNEIKLAKLPEIAKPVTLISDDDFFKIFGYKSKFAGPINIGIPLIADKDVTTMHNFACGSNHNLKYIVNVNWGRDLPIPNKILDIRKVTEGDLSPDGIGILKFARGIEVGQIFQLEKKYSHDMKATIINKEGKNKELFMGCYGIGVSRLVAAAIEQNHDEKGIIWSEQMAPFQIVIIPINFHKSYRIRELSEKIYNEIKYNKIDVLIDDRKERPGVLFSDMDLIGIPHKIIISESDIDNGYIEYKSRINNLSEKINIDSFMIFIKNKLKI